MPSLQRRARGLMAASIAAAALGPSCGAGSSSNTTSDSGAGVSVASGSGGSTGGSGGDDSSAGRSSGTGGSSGAAGSSGAGGSSGAAGSSGAPGDAGIGTCLGSSALSALGKGHMLIGGSMQDATAAMAPFDLRYNYISGGLFDGTAPCASCATGCTTNGGSKSCAASGGCSWWGCWQYDMDPPGAYVRGFASTCAKASPAQIPMISYYQILQSSGVSEGAPEVTQAATNQAFMARYFADWRFLLQQIGRARTDAGAPVPAILHIEPDFWGYAEQHASDPHSETAAVANANMADCASIENSIAGMGQCMVSMVRKYAPNALVGLHASAWSTNMDVAANTSASFDVAKEAAKTAAFLAACGESSADLVIVETSDRDAGYYQTVKGRSTWWDATNATLPDFSQDFAWVQALTTALGKPALYWQTPLGNANQNNTANHYKDNRVDYFFGHMSELARAHAIGAAFGAGAGDQTTPESDGGNFVTKAKAYFAGGGGGQALCGP
jgi:hypothetical protein